MKKSTVQEAYNACLVFLDGVKEGKYEIENMLEWVQKAIPTASKQECFVAIRIIAFRHSDDMGRSINRVNWTNRDIEDYPKVVAFIKKMRPGHLTHQ
jgi:hypothetical protein